MKISRRTSLPILSTIAALTSFSANAEYEAERFYAALSVNAISYDTDEIEKGFDEISDMAGSFGGDFSASVDNTDAGFKILAGYQFTENFAFELGYLDAGELSVNTDLQLSASLGNETYSVSSNSVSTLGVTGVVAAAVGNFALTDELNVFAKVGILSWETESYYKGRYHSTDEGSETFSESSTFDGEDIIFSLGLSYDISDVTIFGEYEVLTLNNDDAQEELDEDFEEEGGSDALDMTSFNLGFRYAF